MPGEAGLWAKRQGRKAGLWGWRQDSGRRTRKRFGSTLTGSFDDGAALRNPPPAGPPAGAGPRIGSTRPDFERGPAR